MLESDISSASWNETTMKCFVIRLNVNDIYKFLLESIRTGIDKT